jgi:hypothetical protein
VREVRLEQDPLVAQALDGRPSPGGLEPVSSGSTPASSANRT